MPLWWWNSNLTSMLHRSHIDVTQISHRCYIDLTSMLHRSHIDVTQISHRCYTDLTSMLHRSNIDVTKISHQRCYTALTLMLHCWCMLFIQDLVTKEWIFTTVKQMKITPMLNRFLYLIQPGPLESLLDLKVMVYHQCSNQPAHWGLSFEPNSTIPRGWDNWYTQIEDPEK